MWKSIQNVRHSLCLSLHSTLLIEKYLVNFGKSIWKIHISRKSKVWKTSVEWNQLLLQSKCYLPTVWCRVLLEKLTGLQLVKKFQAFYGTRRFITALTNVRHLSLSWASPIQSIYPHPTSWRSILILSTHLRLGLPSGLFPSGFPTKNLYTPSPHPYAQRAQPITFFSILSPAQYWVRSTNHLAPRYEISSISPLPRPSYVQIFSSTPFSQTPSASFPPAMSTTKFHTHTKQHRKLYFDL